MSDEQTEHQLYGLMAVAEEYQKSAQKQQEAAEKAIQGIPEATRAATSSIVAEVRQAGQQARQSVTESASEARRAFQRVQWLYVAVAFVLGVAVAAGGMTWYFGGKLDTLQQYSAAIYQQVKPAKK